MSDVREMFNAVGQVVEANTSDTGIDILNVIMILVDAMKENPDLTIEDWEILRGSINNMSILINNVVDEEIAQLTGG